MVTGDYPPALSGVGDYAYHVAQALAARGRTVRVLTTARPDVPAESAGTPVAVCRKVAAWTAGDLPRLLESLDRRKPLLVNIQYNCPATYGRRLMINVLPAALRCVRRNVRTIVTMHGFWEQSRLYRLRCLPMLRAAHGVVFVDRKNSDLLRRYAGRRVPLRFIPITGNIPPLACDAERRECWRQQFGMGSSEVVVAFFGGIGRVKGFEYLVHAIDKARNVEKLPVSLLAIGGVRADGVNTQYQREIGALIADPARAAWIKVVSNPPPDVVSKLLHAADIGAFPFVSGVGENSGSTLAALQHGLPTITTRDATQMPEELGTIAVPARDVTALAEAICRLARSETLRAELGRRSREATAHWTWERVADSMLAFCDGLLGPLTPASAAESP